MKPEQKKLDLEPDYVTEDGVKHEFTGTLFVPLEGQPKRETVSPIVTATPMIHESPLARFGFNRTRKVKMNWKEALTLRVK